MEKSIERAPLLVLDINIHDGKNEKLTIYEGDTPKSLSKNFCENFGIISINL